jgi:hypothetical protein
MREGDSSSVAAAASPDGAGSWRSVATAGSGLVTATRSRSSRATRRRWRSASPTAPRARPARGAHPASGRRSTLTGARRPTARCPSSTQVWMSCPLRCSTSPASRPSTRSRLNVTGARARRGRRRAPRRGARAAYRHRRARRRGPAVGGAPRGPRGRRALGLHRRRRLLLLLLRRHQLLRQRLLPLPLCVSRPHCALCLVRFVVAAPGFIAADAAPLPPPLAPARRVAVGEPATSHAVSSTLPRRHT